MANDHGVRMVLHPKEYTAERNLLKKLASMFGKTQSNMLRYLVRRAAIQEGIHNSVVLFKEISPGRKAKINLPNKTKKGK